MDDATGATFETTSDVAIATVYIADIAIGVIGLTVDVTNAAITTELIGDRNIDIPEEVSTAGI